MKIRLANEKDIPEIEKINTNISYISTSLLCSDVQAHRLFIGIEKNEIVSTCAIVPEPQYNYIAMKRLYINPNCRGKGYAQKMISYFIARYPQEKLGATPWTSNDAMRHMLEKQGFTLRYIFNEKWCFYST